MVNDAQVTRTPAGLWITYTEDGEGTPISPGVLDQDIITGDMWFLSGGHAVQFAVNGEWMTYTVEDFGYESPRYFTGIAVNVAGHTWLGICKP